MENLNLVARIQEALDAEEQLANLMPPFPWTLNAEHDEVLAADGEIVCEPFALSGNQVRNMAEYFARHDPARVLRQVAAHRKILAAHPIDVTRRTKTGEPWFGCRCWLDRDGDVTFGPQLLCDVIPPLAEAYGITVEVEA